MELKQAHFESWAVVELFGHQKEIGFVVTEAFGQAVMFRIDTPDLPERDFTLTSPEYAETEPGVRQWCPTGTKVKRGAIPARTRLVGPGAVYAINPCTEEAARAAIEKTVHRPLIVIEMPAGLALPAAEADEDDEEGEPFEDDDECPI